MVQPCERHRTGHFTVYASAVHANATVPFFGCWLHQLLDVVHLAASGQSVHEEEDGGILLQSLGGKPVKRDVASVLEIEALSLEGVGKEWLADVVD